MVVTNFLARLNSVLGEARRMVEQPNKQGDNMPKIRALYLVQRSYLSMVNVLTNSKTRIDEGLKSEHAR
ncbi:MAG: hypothetical protein ACJ70Q_08785 [Nitrososphaera sp.]